MVCKQHLDFYFSLIHGSGTSLVFKNILVLEVCVVLYFAVVTLSSNLQVVHLSWRYGILVASTVIKHWRTCVVILRVFPWKTLANRSYQLLLPTFCPSKNFPKMYFSPSATVTPTFPRPRTMKIGIPHVSREEDFFFQNIDPKRPTSLYSVRSQLGWTMASSSGSKNSDLGLPFRHHSGKRQL